MTHPQLETERLILRQPLREDFDAYAMLLADEEAARFIGGHVSRAVAWRKFLMMVGAWQIQGFAMFSVIERATGRWVGQLGPWRPEGWPGNEMGWAIDRAFWGKGYAFEGTSSALDWAFDTLDWDDVIHCIHPDNGASIGLAKRLGSSNRGPGKLPSPYEDSPNNIWGQTREQWRTRRRGAAA
ncbi:MAG: GNAT family N-acetyltransferase [Pseudomonadota bacterium]|nr:GNAT family N-acetyltransferase [Pseudomonadota bacterium]